MIYHTFTKKELEKKLNDIDFWQTPILPITPYRSFSHINNPSAKDEDICLIVAMDEQKVKGYIGVIPDYIRIDNKKIKIGVLSSWWVDQKSKGLGALLLYQVFKVYSGSIIAMYFSKDAGMVYEKSGLFIPLKEQTGRIFYCEVGLKKRLLNRFHLVQYFGPLFGLFESILSVMIKILLMPWKIKNTRYKNFEYVNRINDEIYSFIKQHNRKELFENDIENLNWKLHYKWVVSAPFEDRMSVKYRFSSVINRLEFFPIKLYDNNNEIIGFVIIRIRNNRITVPYCYYKEGALKHIANLICHHLTELKAGSLELYHASLIEEITRSKFPFVFEKASTKKIFIGKQYETFDFKECHIQPGDGEGTYTF